MDIWMDGSINRSMFDRLISQSISQYWWW